jgi:hypothetical protein
MAAFEKGDSVIAIKDVGGGWSPNVRKGTRGVVVGVEVPWFGSDKFTVRFENDEIEEVTENEIYAD